MNGFRTILTMKVLYVMRHAKSSWGEPGLDDFDRPLLEKGKKRTRLIIEYLLNKGVKPELIISSPAVRASDTAQIIAHGLSVDKDAVKYEKSIYSSDSEKIEDLFYDLPNKISEIMLIGHNPAVTNFVNTYLENKVDALPTSSVAAIQFDTNEWDKVLDSTATVLFLIFPKMLG